MSKDLLHEVTHSIVKQSEDPREDPSVLFVGCALLCIRWQKVHIHEERNYLSQF